MMSNKNTVPHMKVVHTKEKIEKEDSVQLNDQYKGKQLYYILTNNKGNATRIKIEHAVFADKIIEDNRLIKDYTIHRYENNLWLDTDDRHIRNIIRRELQKLPEGNVGSLYKETDVDKITKIINDKLAESNSETVTDRFIPKDGNEYWIQFNNGTLDLENWEFHKDKFYPEKHILNAIDRTFPVDLIKTEDGDPTENLTEYAKLTLDRFVDVLKGDEQAAKFLEFLIGSVAIRKVGQILNDENKESLTFLTLFHGGGNDGKSKTAEYIQDLYVPKSNQNVSNTSLTQMISRFGAQDLIHKLVNIAKELDFTSSQGTNMLKAYSGNDLVKAEKKGDNTPYNFVNYATLIFVSNPYPRMNDDTRGMRRRMLVFEFADNITLNREFRRKYPDSILTDFDAQTEVLTKCLYMVYQQIAGKADYMVKSPAMERAIDTWYSKGANLNAVIKRLVTFDPKCDDGVSLTNVHQILNKIWTDDNNKPINTSALKEKLQAIYPDIEGFKTIRKRMAYGPDGHDKQLRIIKGLTFNQDEIEEFIQNISNDKDKDKYLSFIPTKLLQDINVNINNQIIDNAEIDDMVKQCYEACIKPYIKIDTSVKATKVASKHDVSNPFNGITHTDNPFDTHSEEKNELIEIDMPTIRYEVADMQYMHTDYLYRIYVQRYGDYAINDPYKHNMVSSTVFATQIKTLLQQDGYIITPIEGRHKYNVEQVAFDYDQFTKDGYVMNIDDIPVKNTIDNLPVLRQPNMNWFKIGK